MSTELQHTPRLWQISYSATARRWDIFNADGYWIGAAFRKETADLLAAAPDLLEALIGMLSIDEEYHQRGSGDEDVSFEVRKARAAIAKATGKEAPHA